MRTFMILGAAAAIAAAVPATSALAQGVVVNPGPQAMGPGPSGGGGFRGGGGGFRGGWAGGGYRGYRGGWVGGPRYGYRHWGGYPRYGYRRHYGAPFWGGLAAGAIIGGTLAYPPAYEYEYAEPGLDPAVAACARRYRTYDIETQTYIARPGVRRRCP